MTQFLRVHIDAGDIIRAVECQDSPFSHDKLEDDLVVKVFECEFDDVMVTEAETILRYEAIGLTTREATYHVDQLKLFSFESGSVQVEPNVPEVLDLSSLRIVSTNGRDFLCKEICHAETFIANLEYDPILDVVNHKPGSTAPTTKRGQRPAPTSEDRARERLANEVPEG